MTKRTSNQKGYPNWFRRLQKKLPYPVYQYASRRVITILYEQDRSPDEIAEILTKNKESD